jgi:hypothetical protein
MVVTCVVVYSVIRCQCVNTFTPQQTVGRSCMSWPRRTGRLKQHQLHCTRSAAVMGHLHARPATENSRNAVYPLVVELAPLSAALPVVVLSGEPQ